MPQKIGYRQGSSPRSACVEGAPCVVLRLGKIEVLSNSFALYVIAVSVLCQAIMFVSVGAMADYGSYRKKLLFISTVVGSISAILMLTVLRPSLFWYAALLSIVMNVAFGTATVFYNAYLPLLVKSYRASSADVEVMVDECGPTKEDAKAEEIPSRGSNGSNLKKLDDISSYISTRGFIVGYLGAFLVLIISVLYLHLRQFSFYNLQMCVALCGVWWLAGSIYSFAKLKTRPGPYLPQGSSYLVYSWKKVGKTVKKCRQLPVTFWFLLCFFLFSDGYSTLGAVAVLFARTEMKMPYEKVIIAVLVSPFSSVLGNFFFFYLQKWTKMSSKSILLALLTLMGLVICYGLSGIFTSIIGLHHEWEMYLFACTYGFIVGALQSYSRVIYSELIPPGDEAEFFSLYAITDKGSSWLGPLLQSLAQDLTGNSRFGFFVLIVMVWAPIPVIVWLVDMPKGIRDAKAFHNHSDDDI